MSIIQGTSKTSAAAGYSIDQSIRFDSVRNYELYRTLPGDGNLKTGTFSFWMKRSGLGSLQEIFTTYSIRSSFFFNSNDTLSMQIYNGASYTTLTTTAVFRDPSAFGHYLFRWDTTQATDTDRLQFYYNGVLQTVTGTYPAQNSTTTFSDATYTHVISGDGTANTLYEIDGYLAEIHYVDGTALAATDFGEYNSDTGQWVPIEASPTYGTNGFYITGADSADLGADDSGNGNDFTSSGLTAADQVSDSPTNNQATLNPLFSGVTLSDGNLVATASGNSYQRAFSTFAIDDGGKHVCEFQKSSGTFGLIGIMQNGNHTNTTGNSNMFGINLGNGEVFKGNPTASVLTTVTAPGNSLMRIEYDSSADTITIFDDGTEIFPASTGVSDTVGLTGHDSLHFGCAPYASGTVITATFSPLSGTPTTGFKELTTTNLDDPTIADPSAYFQTTLYTGNASTQEVNQSGNSTFEPGLVWIKTRSNAASHALFDQVRGVNKQLRSDSNGAEYTAYSDLLTAFDADGFTLGADATVNNVNVNTYTYAAWQWAADGTSGSSNTDGSITSTVSANTTSGFSAGIYTGNATNNATVGHGLGIAPKIVFVKRRAITGNWRVYSEAVNQVLYLDLTNAGVSPTEIKSTSSTVFTLGSSNGVNGSGDTHVFYAWAEVEGFSKFGSFTGNGSTTDGPFIYTGFTPEFFMWKRTNSATYGDWTMMDTKRDPFNMAERNMRANSTIADDTGEANLDFVSNGIKHRGGTSARFNQSGATYIYMAFASSPFKTATAR